MSSTNLIIVILFGACTESLFGMIRMIQLLALLQLINVIYPVNMMDFFGVVMTLADFDVLQGPLIMSMIFDPVDSGPLSAHFEVQGMSDMIMLNQIGSMQVAIFLIILSHAVWKCINMCARRCYRFRCCRKLGIEASSRTVFYVPLMVLFVEGYVDLALAVFINLYAMVNSQWEDPKNQTLQFENIEQWKNIWFGTNDMIVNSTLTLLGSLIVLFIPFYILVIL